ncbi:uncharacterized protein N7446_003954 [Penicillium canescens]|uniref:Uncharacterized protein n=1 Tax=Penicillium canescens TaxID=5083 RepID=A0AAD6I375_PENCN|nr:uncharacterized protein N7446_003954 [Penicillium canescens]KAJ6027454.1 hypothetical protein N7460_012271 [Penicillium canescens]KAJ6040730.1 hypothetical protein N7444_009635 [Penicillium canescens]KAJ6066917.1 hypothetical protein N7446_003954 [Penicillium canescens]
MRLNLITISTSISLGLLPQVSAILGTACISVMSKAGIIQAHLTEQIQRQACDAGCEPRFDSWDKHAKDILLPLIEEAAKKCDVKDGTDVFFEVVDQFHQNTKATCEDKIRPGGHFCDHPESLQPYLNCAKENSVQNSARGLLRLVPYMSDGICSCLEDYMMGSQLWEQDFPKLFVKYVDQCHEDL